MYDLDHTCFLWSYGTSEENHKCMVYIIQYSDMIKDTNKPRIIALNHISISKKRNRNAITNATWNILLITEKSLICLCLDLVLTPQHAIIQDIGVFRNVVITDLERIIPKKNVNPRYIQEI